MKITLQLVKPNRRLYMNNDVLNNQVEMPKLNSINSTVVNPVVEPITNAEEKTEEKLDKLKKEETVGEHDIVIEEDFDIELDLTPVSSIGSMFGSQTANNTGASSTIASGTLDLPSEQSGNIIF